MHIVVVGLNHKLAPVAVRERLSIGPEDMAGALTALRESVQEGVILSTCNRTEVYGLADHPGNGARSLRAFFSRHRGLPLTEFDLYLYSHHDIGAIRHLFRVAAGLDSMIVGEPQILGQVRGAYEAADTSGSTGPVMSALFRQAITAGKRVQTETEISRHAVSVSYAAVELARKIFGALASRSVLIVGAGEMAELALRTLVDNGVGHVLVANRTLQRAEELAAQYPQCQTRAADLRRLDSLLAQADIVISSTAATRYVLTESLVRGAMRARRNRPLFLIDIAVPRDIDPEVQRLENVFLYNVDDLQAVCDANMQERAKEVGKAEAIIEDEAAKYQAWWSSLGVVPTITALRAWAEEIRQAELRKAMSRLHGLSERDQNVIDALTLGIMNKMLHAPVTGLKSDGHRYVDAVQALFRLNGRVGAEEGDAAPEDAQRDEGEA